MGRSVRRMTTAALVLLLGLSGAPAADADGKLFLWEVESRQSKVYLLGSIHLAKPELYPLNSAIEDAFERASTLVVEADINRIDETEMNRMISSLGMYADGRTLSGAISEDTLGRLQGYLDGRGLPLTSFQVMRPWLAAMFLSVSELQRLGYDPAAGIDKHFLDRAAAEGKPVVELESARAQVEMLAGFSEPLQEYFLLQTLREADRIPEIIESLMTAWHGGDPESIESLLLEEMASDERLEPLFEKIYAERNAAMTTRIRAFLESGGVHFVVVGAAHLVGDRGILGLLGREKEAGYSIRQVAASEAPVPAAAVAD